MNGTLTPPLREVTAPADPSIPVLPRHEVTDFGTPGSGPRAPLLAPEAMEKMFGGLDKMHEALPPDRRQQMEDLLQTSDDAAGEKAGWANVAFLADRYGKDPAEIAQNSDAYREDYAHQMGWKDEDGADDKAFYSRVGQHYQTQRDEQKLIIEAQGKLYDAFRSGSDDWKQTFNQSMKEMVGKPGYDAKRLDVYRNLAETQWKQWQDIGQHYPAAVDTVAALFKQARTSDDSGINIFPSIVRNNALMALKTVPAEDQEAVLALAMRGLPEKGEQGLGEKLVNRAATGTGELLKHGIEGGIDMTMAYLLKPTGMKYEPDYATRALERKLDAALTGQVDPNSSKQWLARATLGAAEGLPRMIAMAHPAGIALNLGAFSEESRAHFEDSGMDPKKAAILGPIAGVTLTALQAVTSQMVMGKTVGGMAEGWMAKNIAGKFGPDLVKGYAKNFLATAAIDTATFIPITAGQMLTEPAVQAIAGQLDHTIPGIQWSGKGGELEKLYKATPETLAGLVPLIVLGSGMGALRTREFARNTVHNETAIKALGFDAETTKQIMEAKEPEHAAMIIAENWDKRRPDDVEATTAMEALNAKNEKAANRAPNADSERYQQINERQAEMVAEARQTGAPFIETPEYTALAKEREEIKNRHGGMPPGQTAAVALNHDGNYLIKDSDGNVVDQAGSAETAALAMKPDLAGEGLGTERPKAMHYGIVDPTMMKAMDFIRDIGNGVKNLWQQLRSIPEFGPFKKIINEFNGEQQIRQMRLAAEVRQVFDAVPDRLTRRAMYRAIEAGFDKKQLQEWARASTRKSSKEAYEAALKLTPEQIDYAKKIQQWFEAKHPQAVEAGLLEAEKKRKNYVPLVVDKPYDVKGLPSKYKMAMKGDFSHAISRDFETSFDLENAVDENGDNLGLKLKTDDLPEIMASYASELDKVDLTRQALKKLESSKAKAADGELLVQPVHGVLQPGKEPGTGGTISNPSSTVSESNVRYETLDHPAFKRWYFAGQDADKNPIMFKGEMGLHPDIYNHMANILGRSKIQNWLDTPGSAAKHVAQVAVKSFQEAQKFVKANMFAASAFHATHIATRAAGNLVAPWELRPVTPDDPVVIKATNQGLQLSSDSRAMQTVMEGLGGGKDYNVLAKVPGIGKIVKGVTDLTFHEIIPRYKLATWEKLNEKNLKIFAKDIKSGRVTEDQVGYLTSHQVNNRFGELNYTDLGTNPTFKHILSLLTLAPDFWRSTLSNLGEVAVGLTGAKAGRQPAQAFVITAATTWLAARVLNKALSDEDSYHFEDPFAVHVGNRTYTFRTEVNDVYHMVAHTNQYLMGRLSPFASSALEYLSGVNWRGEKVSFTDVLKEAATKAIPAALKFLPGVSDLDEWGTGRKQTTTHFEQFLTSQGIQVRRSSPLNDAYQLVNDWKKSVGKDEKPVAYPVSKYQQLRYALEDDDMEKAKAELSKLITDKTPPGAIAKGFHGSIFHLWTGSRKDDAAFRASLSEEDKAKLERADKHRLEIWSKFNKLPHADEFHPPTDEP